MLMQGSPTYRSDYVQVLPSLVVEAAPVPVLERGRAPDSRPTEAQLRAVRVADRESIGRGLSNSPSIPGCGQSAAS
jgi:hypothetical protein